MIKFNIFYLLLVLCIYLINRQKEQKTRYILKNSQVLVILKGKIEIQKQNHRQQTQSIQAENYDVQIKTIENCEFLEVQKKVIQKITNQIMRLDHQYKQQFLSNYLFCGMAPFYCHSSIQIIKPLDKLQNIQQFNQQIILILQGIVKRSNKTTKQSIYLTSGSLLSVGRVSYIINRQNIYLQDVYQANKDVKLICFLRQQFQRIVVLNTQLKNKIKNWLQLITEQRKNHSSRNYSVELTMNKTIKDEVVTANYPIKFMKNRGKSANPSFRRKINAQNDPYLGDFVSIARYSKMIESKERVMQAQSKQIKKYQNNYQNKQAYQQYYNKQLKIQTGKIHKRSQRQDISGKEFGLITQGLRKVQHFFQAKKLTQSMIYSETSSQKQNSKPNSIKKILLKREKSNFKPKDLSLISNNIQNDNLTKSQKQLNNKKQLQIRSFLNISNIKWEDEQKLKITKKGRQIKLISYLKLQQ